MSICEYPDYKGSNLPYIDLVPSHWTLKKIAWDIPYSVGWTPPSGNEDYYDGDIPWVTIGDLEKQSIKSTKSTITELAVDVRKAKPVPSGSLLFSFKLSVGKVTFAEIECFTNEAIAAFEPNKTVILSYWYYASPLIIPHYGRDNIYGAKLLNQDLIGSVKFYCPSKTEQQKIAQFLDHETSKIDALIDEQKRLIELLKEKRQAVISHAVTKGLNPDAPMKDSGVEWLGEVPEHWKVASLKAFIRLVESGTSVNAADTPASEGELGVLKTSAVYGDELDVNQNKTVVKEEESRVSCQLKANRLIVSRMNTPELVGATGFSLTNPGNLFLPDRLWQITLENVESQFIFMFTLSKSYRSQIKLVCAGASSSMQNIAQEDFKNVKIAVPPLIEQKAIVDEWHRFKSNSNQLTEQAEKAVKLLQERRSALISAAVTGKIDVRDWQPPAGSDTVDSNASMQTERHYG